MWWMNVPDTVLLNCREFFQPSKQQLLGNYYSCHSHFTDDKTGHFLKSCFFKKLSNLFKMKLLLVKLGECTHREVLASCCRQMKVLGDDQVHVWFVQKDKDLTVRPLSWRSLHFSQRSMSSSINTMESHVKKLEARGWNGERSTFDRSI